MDNETDKSKLPLGLPEGSIRAIISILLIIFYFVTGIVNGIDISNDLKDLTIAIIAFYFGTRAGKA
jgi:hypothetical protein